MNLNIDFFRMEQGISPAKGRVLISDPFLNDAYFKRSLVLLVEHGEEGSVGFVLNKPIEIDPKEVLTDFPAMEVDISVGGPVGSNTVHYIHTLGEAIPNSVKVTNGIYWGGDFNVIKDLVEARAIDKTQIRFFLGYSGWQPKQLDGELSQNAWAVEEITPGQIMTCFQENSWKQTLENLGRKYKIWLNTPENPAMN
ncbi:MAG: YqgE/AlgH family protein [Bacteroidales bacterium]